MTPDHVLRAQHMSLSAGCFGGRVYFQGGERAVEGESGEIGLDEGEEIYKEFKEAV